MEENIIVCRTADGDLIAYDSFADAVANAVENSDKDIAEIAVCLQSAVELLLIWLVLLLVLLAEAYLSSTMQLHFFRQLTLLSAERLLLIHRSQQTL